MIGVLLLSATFMMLIFFAMLILAFTFKKWIQTWVQARDEVNRKKIEELKGRVDEIQGLFKKEIMGLLNDFKNVIDK